MQAKNLNIMSYKQKVTDMYQMIGQGQMLEAFEKFYHEDVVMIEPVGEPRQGKAANREFEQNWAKGIKEQHGGGVDSITADEENGITTVEAWFDATYQDGNRMTMKEVAVQQWKDDQIIQERFYYNVPGQ